MAKAIFYVVHEPEIQRRAEDLGTKIREEDGIDRAIQIIDQMVRKH